MYQVSQHIDNNKIFIVQRSEIERRLDPHYNMPKYSELYRVLDSLPCRLSSLKEESTVIYSGITPKSGGEAYTFEANGVPFVRSGDFTETNLIDFSKLLYLKPDIHNGTMSASKLKRNDVLFAIVGATIGKIGIYRYDREANINQAICGVRLKSNVSPFFVQAFYQTSIGQKILERTKRPVARANLNLEEIGRLPIPLVNEDIQRKVVDRLQNGIEQKKQKESEAQQLLDSIDAYILNELGITLPEIKTDLKSRMFLVNRSELEERLDPKFSKDFSYLKNLTCKYPFVTLNNIILNNGQYGANERAQEYEDGDVRFIRITDIDELGCLKSDGKRSATNIENCYKLNFNDVLFARSGSVGKCYIHKEISAPAIFAGYLIRFLINDNLVNADYLFYYCNSKLYNYWVNTIQRPAVQANINAQEFRSMPIPLPPLTKQQEIANHIYAIRQQAKQLQEEGKAILENAKKEVEQMIIR